MNQRAADLAERFRVFNNEVISLVENCSEEDWQKTCSGEEWTVAVVAHHLAAGHYGALDLAKMIVAGEPLPQLSMEAIDQMNARHAQENANCTKSEVLSILRRQGSAITDYLGGLSETDLDKTGSLALLGGEISTLQFIEKIILDTGTAHLASMRNTTGT